ncbi:glutathione S-transferase class-mu 26 kDa isozyme 47-like [Penaeus chinensis]|uniref:glutathione S-transferase class-mu 26 kDa isozyme 47-like n=1 Tax=Penaeus chinensis TaxID=139456 RepID=UPI001FB5D789|nr:glutathione S-transferase class-mu 26 kDa isozyme 47-like [Penaeus chinensis]
MPAKLGYWKIRGLAQSIRLLLEFTGTEYEEKLYADGPSEWLSEKEALGLDFPNLPYYIADDVKLSQSMAILLHVGRKHDMCGTTDAERSTIDMLVHVADDIRMHYSLFVYLDYKTKKIEYYRRMHNTGERLSKYLGDKKWFMGDTITVVDFLMYELLDIHLKVKEDWLQDFNNLQEFHKRFEALPAIQEYMASPRFIPAPLNGASAKFDIV